MHKKEKYSKKEKTLISSYPSRQFVQKKKQIKHVKTYRKCSIWGKIPMFFIGNARMCKHFGNSWILLKNCNESLITIIINFYTPSAINLFVVKSNNKILDIRFLIYFWINLWKSKSINTILYSFLRKLLIIYSSNSILHYSFFYILYNHIKNGVFINQIIEFFDKFYNKPILFLWL